jgi:hypothetical protein
MKGNIRKLALLMIITAVVPLIFAATALPDPPDPITLHGTYAGSGSGISIWAYCGFAADFVPN